MSTISSNLANPVWQSLAGAHASLAQGRHGAMRYDPGVAPFGALEQQSHTCVDDLARLMEPGEEVCLIDQQADIPDLFESVTRSETVQMVTRRPRARRFHPPGESGDYRGLTSQAWKH